jgi:cytolysin-activating lysine-acyltransferase
MIEKHSDGSTIPNAENAKVSPLIGNETIRTGDTVDKNYSIKNAENNGTHIDTELKKKLATVRTKAHEVFGRVVIAMTTSSRHRHVSILELQSLVLEPLMRDRIAFAQPKLPDGPVDEGNALGIAIWASVSKVVDEKICEQIKAGVFPIHLKPDEWTSGEINWLLDVIAPDAKLTTAVIANFKQVIKQSEMRIHPIVARMVDPQDLKKMGLRPMTGSEGEAS